MVHHMLHLLLPPVARQIYLGHNDPSGQSRGCYICSKFDPRAAALSDGAGRSGRCQLVYTVFEDFGGYESLCQC